MSLGLNPTDQQIAQPATDNQAVVHNWDSKATHAMIDSTCDKVGSFIIKAGNLCGGPAAAAIVDHAIEASKRVVIAANQPAEGSEEVSTEGLVINQVLDIVKIPLSVAAQQSGPLIAEASVKIIMPLPRACAHGAVNAVEKSAECSTNLWK